MKKKLLLCLTLMLIAVFSLSALASGTVKVSASVNIRKYPGTNSKVVSYAEKGERFDYANDYKYDSRDVKWYKIFYSGSKVGWVSSKYATVKSSSVSSSKANYVRATANTYVRKGAGMDYDTRGVLEPGKKLTYKGTYRRDDRGIKWYKVSYKGKTGWVSCHYSKLVK